MEIIIRIKESAEYPKALELSTNLLDENTSVEIVLAVEEKPTPSYSFFDSLEREAEYERQKLQNPLRKNESNYKMP